MSVAIGTYVTSQIRLLEHCVAKLPTPLLKKLSLFLYNKCDSSFYVKNGIYLKQAHYY